jgi:ribosomal protein L1
MKVTNERLLKKLQQLKEGVRLIQQEIKTIKLVVLEQSEEEQPESKTKGPTAGRREHNDDDGKRGEARGPTVIKEGMAVRVTTNPYKGRTGVIVDRRSKMPQPNGKTYWHIRLDIGDGSKRGPIVYKMEKYLAKTTTG